MITPWLLENEEKQFSRNCLAFYIAFKRGTLYCAGCCCALGVNFFFFL